MFVSKIILEQLNRPEERRCPVAKVSNEIVELLCEYWEIFAPGCMHARYILNQLYLTNLSILFDFILLDRFDVNHVPAVLPEFLQGSCPRNQIFPSVRVFSLWSRISLIFRMTQK